jgi:hypothetical protein
MDINDLEREVIAKEDELSAVLATVLESVRPLEDVLGTLKAEKEPEIEASDQAIVEAIDQRNALVVEHESSLLLANGKVAAALESHELLMKEYQESLRLANEKLDQAKNLHTEPLQVVQGARDQAVKAWKDAHIPETLRVDHAFCTCGQPMSSRRETSMKFSVTDGKPEPASEVWIWACPSGIEGHDRFTV